MIAAGTATGPIGAILESCTSSITFFNPIMTILFVGCYRRTVFSFFTRKRVSAENSANGVHTGTAAPSVVLPEDAVF